jgi:hypothetical protein
MVRHPADVAVSQYFQWKHRILPRKKWLNEYPLHGADISMFDLVMDSHAGVPYVIDFLNGWNLECEVAAKLFILRYEDLHKDPCSELDRALTFMGFAATAEELTECVRFGSFDNMRRLEQENTFFLSGRRLRKASGLGDEALKVRRGRAGGWGDYFDAEQAERIQSLVDTRLAVGFGYRSDECYASNATDTGRRIEQDGVPQRTRVGFDRPMTWVQVPR